jgi:hypothetical protein
MWIESGAAVMLHIDDRFLKSRRVVVQLCCGLVHAVLRKIVWQ